jgi:hypothetical protein
LIVNTGEEEGQNRMALPLDWLEFLGETAATAIAIIPPLMV